MLPDKAFQLFLELVHHPLGSPGRRLAEGLAQALLLEFTAAQILRLLDAIGVEQKKMPTVKPDLKVERHPLEYRALVDPDREPSQLENLHFAGLPA